MLLFFSLGKLSCHVTTSNFDSFVGQSKKIEIFTNRRQKIAKKYGIIRIGKFGKRGAYLKHLRLSLIMPSRRPFSTIIKRLEEYFKFIAASKT
uniref:Putative secreted protein n=1 Tax=Xenopsylla cheopis TaxID=163159 RepID=A0A6M2DUW5_XENCH